MSAAPGVKNGAAAAAAVRVDEIADRHFDPGLAKRLDDQAALPRAIGPARPMLQCASAADAEMRTDRHDAFLARRFDAEELPPVGMAGPRLSTSTVSPGSVPDT